MKKILFLLMMAAVPCLSSWADDIYYCRGGLVGTGDWASTTMYPLTKNADGIYVGNVKLVSRTEMTSSPTLGWGNRVDLFFDKNLSGQCLSSLSAQGRFLTPANKGPHKLASGTGNPFQGGGGEYTVYLDETNMTVTFECVEPAWLDEVQIIGDLEDCSWVGGDNSLRLTHQGNGIYTGTIRFVAPESHPDYSSFRIVAGYANMTEGNYRSATAELRLHTGVVDKCDRYYGEGNWTVEPGEWLVTFDMNHGTIRLNDPSEPDVIMSRAYYELQQTIEETQAAWPKVDLKEVIAVLENNESTDEQLNAARQRIPGIIRAWLLNEMAVSGTSTSPVDGSYLISDADYNNGRGQWKGTSISFSNGLAYASGMDFNHYQTLTDLPNGVYRVNVKGTSRYGSGQIYYTKPGPLSLSKRTLMQYVTASGVQMTRHFNDYYDQQLPALATEACTDEKDLTGEGWYAPYDVATARAYIDDGRYNDNHLYAYVNDGTLTFGLRRTAHQSDDIFVADDWQLEFYGNTASSMLLMVNELNDQSFALLEKPAQTPLKEAFEQVLQTSTGITDDSQLTETWTSLVNAYEALDASMTAYASLQDKVEEMKRFLNENELTGVGADMLRKYLEETVSPGAYPNGSAPYILENGNLDNQQIADELAYIETLKESALKGDMAVGTDITDLFQNMDMSKADFAGWEMELNGQKTWSSSGLRNGRPVGCYGNSTPANDATFRLTQTIEGMPNGIYEFSLNGFYRPGGKGNVDEEQYVPLMICVNDFHTPMMNIVEGALPENEAQVGVNCADDDYSNGDFRYPDSSGGAAIALNAGRYGQKAYGIVTDGRLTIGFEDKAFPAYSGIFCAFANLHVRYLGTTEEAASLLTDAMATRGENFMASDYSFRAETREALGTALESSPTDAAGLCEKATTINQQCNDALVTAAIYTRLEDAISQLYANTSEAAEAGHLDSEKAQTYVTLYTTVMAGIWGGTYSDEEASKLAEEYAVLADKFLPIYCRGGLQDVANWADNKLYPLYINDEGIYEGLVKFNDCSDLSTSGPWGSRDDLFFKFPDGTQYGMLRTEDKFITPAHCGPFALGEWTNLNTFQAVGGDYMVRIDREKMTVSLECVREFWMDSVFCAGTLDGVSEWNYKDYTYSLKHQGNGIYRGTIKVTAAEGSTTGRFAVIAAYNTDGKDGRYSPAMNTALETGWTMAAQRCYISGSSYWEVEPGEWVVTFDMNNSTIRINTVAEPDVNHGMKDTETPPIFAQGGLLDVGNWAVTDEYPLYKNEEGIYVGLIKMTDLTLSLDATRWGNRSDLFFRDSSGAYYGASSSLNNDQKFFTPAKNGPFPMQTGNSSVFQTVAGDYMAYVDLDRMQVRFECINEAWLPEVFVGGTLVGHRWKNSVAEDRSNVLTHVGHGVYQGIIDLEEDNTTLGSFYIETAYNAGNEGRYSPIKDKMEVRPGETLEVGRYNDSKLSIAAATGHWLVTFDMSHGTVAIADPSDVETIKAYGYGEVNAGTAVGLYTLDGKLLYRGMGRWNTLRPGIYIMKTANEVKKVLIK